MTDVSAVPMLHAPDPDPAGNELDEASWAALIDTLRPRLLALAPRELCNFCRESYYHDLLSLVISNPASDAILERLQAALSKAVFDSLAEDCKKYGPSRLASNLACGTFKRVDALLTKFAAARATAEHIEQLERLAQQMAQLDDGLFDVVLKNLKGAYLEELMKSSGGPTGDLARRLRAHFADETWEMLNRDSAEPIYAKEAEEAIAELPVVLTGQDWKSPQQRWNESEEGQREQREFDAFLTEFLDSSKKSAAHAECKASAKKYWGLRIFGIACIGIGLWLMAGLIPAFEEMLAHANTKREISGVMAMPMVGLLLIGFGVITIWRPHWIEKA